jgi:hypothetical protein
MCRRGSKPKDWYLGLISQLLKMVTRLSVKIIEE